MLLEVFSLLISLFCEEMLVTVYSSFPRRMIGVCTMYAECMYHVCRMYVPCMQNVCRFIGEKMLNVWTRMWRLCRIKSYFILLDHLFVIWKSKKTRQRQKDVTAYRSYWLFNHFAFQLTTTLWGPADSTLFSYWMDLFGTTLFIVRTHIRPKIHLNLDFLIN